MPRAILDTNILIGHWRRWYSSSVLLSEVQIQSMARQLIDGHQTDAIVTPVAIEFFAGTQNAQELLTARIYVGCFRVIDQGRVSNEDWKRAKELAQRIPQSGKPRQLGDCLIRAIADRLNHEVITIDGFFPR